MGNAEDSGRNESSSELASASPGLDLRQVAIGGRPFVLVSDDNYLSGLGEDFEPESVRLFDSLVQPEDTVLDVGANIGCTSLYFGSRAQRVHAFEPSARTFAFLRRNVERSGLDRIHLHPLGLGDENRQLTLTVAPADRSGGFVSDRVRPSGSGHEQEPVSIRRLDDVMVEKGIDSADLLKIDVEGFEGRVLRGAVRTLREHRPLVVAELNHYCLNAFQRTSLPDHIDYLRSVFPILLVVDRQNYMNLHDDNERFVAVHYHILHGRYLTLLGTFDEYRLQRFRREYTSGFEL